jgi:transposase
MKKTMARYTEEFKYSIIKRMMPPQNESVNAIASETGLSVGTLHDWKKKAKAKGLAVPGGELEKLLFRDHFQLPSKT